MNYKRLLRFNILLVFILFSGCSDKMEITEDLIDIYQVDTSFKRVG